MLRCKVHLFFFLCNHLKEPAYTANVSDGFKQQNPFYSACVASHVAQIPGINAGSVISELKSRSSGVDFVCQTIKVKAITVGISGVH